MPDNALVPRRSGYALTRADKARLRIFEEGVGKNLVGVEIDEAIEWCEIYQANPWTNDIYFFTFGEPGTKERRVVPVLSINLYRKQASRSKDYRPDPNPTRFTFDESLIGPDNPKGILNCEVTLYRFSHGEWFPHTVRLSWDERAPIIEAGSEGYEWEDTGEKWPNGKKRMRKIAKGEIVKMLDPKKQNWRTMPESMLEKCAEALAIRKGWPEAVGGSYSEGELDRAEALELTATEVLQEAKREERQSRLGSGTSILVDWMDDKPITSVPADKFHGQVMDFIKAHTQPGHEELSVILQWKDKNREALRQFWALKADEALDIKGRLEAIEKHAAEADEN